MQLIVPRKVHISLFVVGRMQACVCVHKIPSKPRWQHRSPSDSVCAFWEANTILDIQLAQVMYLRQTKTTFLCLHTVLMWPRSYLSSTHPSHHEHYQHWFLGYLLYLHTCEHLYWTSLPLNSFLGLSCDPALLLPQTARTWKGFRREPVHTVLTPICGWAGTNLPVNGMVMGTGYINGKSEETYLYSTQWNLLIMKDTLG